MDGILVIDKPEGMTSHDVVAFLRRKTGVRRIGHSGTLDPMATGVLPTFIGRATRLIEYAAMPGDGGAKRYRCAMKLGLETDTQDIWGEPLTGAGGGGELPDEAEIVRVLKGFEGAGEQLPPMYSAVRVGGRRLYEYARSGAAPDAGRIKPRPIFISGVEIIEVDAAAGEVHFEVLCGKGVYIRTLCADAGRLLGCGAVMSGLVRLASDGFSLDEAAPLDALRVEGAVLPPLLPAERPLAWMPRVTLDADGARAFAMGQRVRVVSCDGGVNAEGFASGKGVSDGDLLRVYGADGARFLGVGKAAAGAGAVEVCPVKVLV